MDFGGKILNLTVTTKIHYLSGRKRGSSVIKFNVKYLYLRFEEGFCFFKPPLCAAVFSETVLQQQRSDVQAGVSVDVCVSVLDVHGVPVCVRAILRLLLLVLTVTGFVKLCSYVSAVVCVKRHRL